MLIWIPITLSGTSDWNHTYVGDSDWEDDYIDSGIVSVNISSSYANSVADLHTEYDSGINDSQIYTTGTMGVSASTFGQNTAWYLLGLAGSAVPCLGTVVSTVQYEDSLFVPAGILSNPNNSQTGSGNFTLAQFGLEHEMTQTGNKYANNTGTNPQLIASWGYDTYALSTVVEVDIDNSDFTNADHLTVGGENIMESVLNDPLLSPTVVTNVGAYASMSVNLVPAYTVHGTAYLNGATMNNQTLVVETPDGNFNIQTDNYGQYQFFAQPGVLSFLTLPSASIGGVQIDPLSTDTSGGTYNLYISTLKFSETGLNNGAPWSVQLKGPLLPSGNQEQYTSPSTSSSSISLPVGGNESYQYFIGVPSGYSVNPYSGFVDVGTGSTPTTVSVTFTQTPTYTVTFHESGLPSGTGWSAKLDGNQKSSTSSSISFYSVPAGSHSYSIPYVYYSTTLWYEPTTGSGSFTLSASKTIDVSFIGVQQNPLSCVAADAQVLLSDYSTTSAQSITMGESVMTYNFSTNSLESGTIQAIFVTQHSNMYDINGYLKVAGDQDIWTDHGYIQAQNLTSNDMIFDVFSHHFYKVRSLAVEHGSYTMYDFYVGGDHNYIVWSNLMEDRLP